MAIEDASMSSTQRFSTQPRNTHSVRAYSPLQPSIKYLDHPHRNTSSPRQSRSRSPYIFSIILPNKILASACHISITGPNVDIRYRLDHYLFLPELINRY